MQTTINRNLLRYAVQRAITCPRCSRILDVRSAVSLTLAIPANTCTDGRITPASTHEYIICGACWNEVRLPMHDVARDTKGTLEVLDGAELFPPTLAEAKKLLKALGMTLRYNRDLEEYSVNLSGGKDATRYYTPDLVDAIGTGKTMAAAQQAKKGGK